MEAFAAGTIVDFEWMQGEAPSIEMERSPALVSRNEVWFS